MADDKELLEKDLFQLLAYDGFIQLNEQISQFNPFEVLKLKGHEIRHSNMLAWLLNPNESHGLGFDFLEQFALAMTDSPVESAETAAAINEFSRKLITTSHPFVKVEREPESKDKKRLDIKILCIWESETPEIFDIIIENKVYSKQGENQLKDYIDYEKKVNPTAKHIPVYLTLDEDDEPTDPSYCHMTYIQIVMLLRKLIEKQKLKGIPGSAFSFIEYYLLTLEELMDLDENKQNLAKDIYRRFKKTIEYINQNAETDFSNAGKQFIQEYNDRNPQDKLLEFKRIRSKFFPFYDEIMAKTSGGSEADWREGKICGYFFGWKNLDSEDYDGQLSIKIEVGPFDDIEKRKQFVELLREHGLISRTSSRTSSTYTKLKYKNQPSSGKKIKDASDETELCKAMEYLFKETAEMRKVLHECIAEFIK